MNFFWIANRSCGKQRQSVSAENFHCLTYFGLVSGAFVRVMQLGGDLATLSRIPRRDFKWVAFSFYRRQPLRPVVARLALATSHNRWYSTPQRGEFEIKAWCQYEAEDTLGVSINVNFKPGLVEYEDNTDIMNIAVF